MRRIRRSISSAHVIAIIALMVALGGTGYAALRIPRSSVGTIQLKKNAVISSRVKDRSLKAIDFKNGQLPRGAQGPQGVTGAQGAPGADGPIGPAGNAGANGTNGTNGTDGTDGTDGAAGPTGPTGPAGIAAGFARVGANGLLDAGTPAQSENVEQANVQHDSAAGPTTTGPGVYCFGGLPFVPRSAMVTTDSAGALNSANFIGSVSVQRGNGLVNCDADHQEARVSMLQVSNTAAPALVDHGFYIWFEK
jgi:hypothetical protein